MKIFVKSILIFMFYTNISSADFIKPIPSLKPFEVVLIQLNSLKNNNTPYKDAGIAQTWEFAHPDNKLITGPLNKFTRMIYSENYKMLLNHLDSEIIEIFKADEKYGFEVKILGQDKNYYKFQWIVEKYSNEGPLKDCWLTTSVSNPISLGSSI